MPVINAELSELNAFLAVADAQSFREAADKLGISQPAVSSRVRRLETKVGLRLFDRTTRRVQLTDAGTRFRERAALTVRDLSALIDDFRDESAMRQGRVIVAVSASIAAVVLPPLIVEYQRRYPKIRVELRETFESAATALAPADVDFAFVSDAIEGPGVRFEHLRTEDFVLFARRGHPIERLHRIGMKDIAGYSVMLPTNSALGALVAARLANESMPPIFPVQSENLLTLLSLVEAGAGLIVLPRLLMARVDLNVVEALDIHDGPAPRRFGLAFRRGRSLSPAARALVRLIQQAHAS